jgi:HTH-type transcriptional regulator/antitoxin HipB
VDDDVVGFYTLVVGQVNDEDAPGRLAKGLAHHPVPIMLLARLAVSSAWQGRKLVAGLHQGRNADLPISQSLSIWALLSARAERFYAFLPINKIYEKWRITEKYVSIPILLNYRIWRICSRMDTMTDLARTPKQIGNLIRRSRRKLGLSQTELGDKAGFRQETISLIESGNPATKLETILAVLAVLDLEFHIVPRSKGDGTTIEDIF